MGQPVKLSDPLILDARLCAAATERSIAGQIEFWAGLGRGLESLLRLDDLLKLKKLGKIRPLSACLAQPGSPEGRKRLARVLKERPFPHYEADPSRPGRFVRIEKDGSRAIGRFVKRRFVPAK